MIEDVRERSAALSVRGPVASRFTRYSGLSLVTIPAGYSLLLLARHLWHVNAGLLNLGVGMVLTVPSFLLYRRFVWREGSGRSAAADLFSFWQTVMIGALASSALIALADAWFRASGPEIVLAGLTGQGIVFLARFAWLEMVTFSATRRAGRPGRPGQLPCHAMGLSGADVDADRQDPPQDPGPGRGQAAAPRVIWRLALALAAVAALAAAGLWIAAAAITAGHGFDVTDEGFYLLSYRWWSTALYTYTGVQYLYGPLFEGLGYSIAALRLLRLATIVGASAVFGWTFMGWLRQRRPRAPATRLWEIAGAAVIVACGGMDYSWIPLSPGYNDVSLLGGLLGASVVLRIATHVDRGKPVPPWVPAAIGPVVVAAALAKWSSAAPTFLMLGVVAVIVVARRGRREVARLAVWAGAGVLVSVGLLQLFVVPLNQALPQMLAASRQVAAGANAPTALFGMYTRTAGHVIGEVVTQNAVLLVAAAFAVLARGRVSRWCAVALIAAGIGISTWRLTSPGYLQGGTRHITMFTVSVLLIVAIVLVVGLAVVLSGWFTRSRACALCTEGGRGWAVLVMLALLPLTQAAGTGNPVYYLAVDAFAAWAAVLIAVLTGMEAAPAVARGLMAVVAAAAVVVSASIATTGLWSFPYRTAGYESTTSVAPGVPALASVKLDPPVGQAYGRLYRTLLPYIEPAGRAMMAFDEMAGVVLFLGGRSVGEAWYSASDHARTAAGIRWACRGGHGWWGSRAPIVLSRAPLVDTEIQALRSCGLIFPADYRLLRRGLQTMSLLVYVPGSEGRKKK